MNGRMTLSHREGHLDHPTQWQGGRAFPAQAKSVLLAGCTGKKWRRLREKNLYLPVRSLGKALCDSKQRMSTTAT
jgi:hypothetical protein